HNDYFREVPGVMLESLKRVGVTNFDMETAGVFVLGHLMNLRVGSILAVRANRETNQLADNGGEERACLAASEPAAILQEQEATKSTRLHYLVSSTLAPGPAATKKIAD